MLRAIREIQPTWIVGENVLGITNWNGGLVFEEVQADLESAGYEVQTYVLPACAVNAPHRRDRVWFVAYRNSSAKKPSRKSGKTKGHWGENNDEQKGGGIERKFNTGCGAVLQSTSDTSKIRLSSSESIGKLGGKQRLTFRYESAIWEKFPTQSPVRSGNDGFSTESLRQRIREDCMGNISEEEIDEIISRATNEWTRETIKAAGNAVVPPLVVEIFKAIDQYSKLNNK